MLERLSRMTFGADAEGADRIFTAGPKYTAWHSDLESAAAIFEQEAPRILRSIVDQLPTLSDTLVQAAVDHDSAVLNGLREVSWLLSASRNIIADARFSVTSGSTIIANPAFSIVKNIDDQQLPMRLYRISGSFEHRTLIDPTDYEDIHLATGEELFINGFDTIAAYLKNGILVANITTVPIGAYEAVFSLVDGQRKGLFSADLRLSSIVVALRVFAMSGQDRFLDVPSEWSTHAVKEVRWSVLNYLWRTSPPDLDSRLAIFLDDADAEIRALAAICQRNLSEGFAHENGASARQ